MTRLEHDELNLAFLDAMGPAVVRVLGPLDADPLELELAPPLPRRARLYIWNATNPPGGRATPEHAIQLRVAGQEKGNRGFLDLSRDAFTIVAGKVEDQPAFVLWDAYMHPDFAHSSNAQVPTARIIDALTSNLIVTHDRRPGRLGQETVIVAPAVLLPDAVAERSAGFLLRRALLPRGAMPPRPGAPRGGRDYIRAEQRRPVPAPKSRVFFVDPDVIDRGTTAHIATQNELAAFLRFNGLAPLSPESGDPQFDIGWVEGSTAFVGEVKSLTFDNEERQLRLGLGQVLSYAYLLDWRGIRTVQPVLIVERQPCQSYWSDLCRSLGVILTWPDFSNLP